MSSHVHHELGSEFLNGHANRRAHCLTRQVDRAKRVLGVRVVDQPTTVIKDDVYSVVAHDQ